MSDKAIRNAGFGVLALYLVALAVMEWAVIADPAFEAAARYEQAALTLGLAPIAALGPCVPVLGILAAVDWAMHARHVPRETSHPEGDSK